MITVKKPSSPAEIRQSVRHVLFVEGSDQDAIDPMALSYLLEEQIRVEPLGASYHIRSAAEGLYKYPHRSISYGFLFPCDFRII